MKQEKIWKFGCFGVAVLLVLYSLHLARMDAVLRGACKKALYHSRFGTYGLYLFFLIAAALLLYALWQWITPRLNTRRMLRCMLAAVCVCAVLSWGYHRYHADVYVHSSREAQAKYEALYDRGLLWDLKGLFR